MCGAMRVCDMIRAVQSAYVRSEDDFTNAIHPCHFEQSEKSKVGNRFAGNDFGFLTAFGMTTSEICEIVLVCLNVAIERHL